MLIAITFISGIALFLSMKFYAGEDRRIPPASSSKGKEARIVVSGIWLVYMAFLVTYMLSQGTGKENILPWISAFVLGGSIPVLRYIQAAKKKQKK